MIHIGTVNGDVLENGAVKYETHHHYYGEKTPGNQPAKELPSELLTPQAHAILEKLKAADILDEHWQPIGLTGVQKGLLAAEVANHLGIRNQWKLFGQLWNEEPETLRSYMNKGMGLPAGGEFIDRLKAVWKD